MSIPKTTKFTLKRIVENLGNIPNKGFSEETPKLSPEQKKRLHEMACMFETFGQFLGKEDSIAASAKSLMEFANLAESYAINECGDWFQQEIIKKDMKSMKQKVQEYGKVARECYARMQQLGVLYEDIKHVAGRYYELEQVEEAMGNIPGANVAGAINPQVPNPSVLTDPEPTPPIPVSSPRQTKL